MRARHAIWVERSASWLFSASAHTFLGVCLAVLVYPGIPTGSPLADIALVDSAADGSGSGGNDDPETMSAASMSLPSTTKRGESSQPVEVEISLPEIELPEETAEKDQLANVSGLDLGDLTGEALADEPIKPDTKPGEKQEASLGQVSYYGISSRANRVVYVVDCSGSMNEGQKFEKATQELINSIQGLSPQQSFFVIFFNHKFFPQFHPLSEQEMLRATPENIAKVVEWIGHAVPHGQTEPLEAALYGLALKPDTMYVLSDGIFPYEVVDAIKAFNKRQRTPIHGISLESRTGGTRLFRLARQNRGRYRFVP